MAIPPPSLMAASIDPLSTFRTIPILALSTAGLESLSKAMKLSLSADDMEAVRACYQETGREPTDVELEVIAQTWSEHCKHRIFSAKIEHTRDGKTEVVDGVFQTCIRQVSLAK